MGISDLIAGFIQEALDETDGVLELQRSDLAQRFGCVPSQINYVMSTRFSPERGYIVESRRGGNGYIRITRVQVDRQTLMMHVINSLGSSVDLASARAILSNLVQSGALEKTVGQALLAAVGDKALVRINYEGDQVLSVSMIDHYRMPWELVMGGMFVLLLVLFAGKTGIRAVLSFILTVLMIWKVMVPLYLKNWNPIWVGLFITLALTVLIIALVYGFDRRCAAAVSGSFLGVLVTCVLGLVFTDLFKICLLYTSPSPRDA